MMRDGVAYFGGKREKRQGQFKVRQMLVPVDVDRVVDLASSFFYESNNRDLTIDTDAYREVIKDYYRYPSVKSFVAVTEQADIVGYIHIYYQQDFTKEKIGELYQMYVDPAYRGTQVGRALVEAAVQQYRDWGCVRAYCECAPGMGGEKHLQTFGNLWGKSGYEPVGRAFMIKL